MRTEGDYIKINEWLKPLSWLYGLGVTIRNKMFDIGILNQKAYDVPVISVGNITVGGSGKTPHVEYLISLLKDKHKTAVLSRGYKRKTRGYVLADENSTMRDIGDEPFQIKRKFKNIYVAVDKKRCDGIEHLLNDEPTKDVEVILLDDAFQHRYVKPGIDILLVDYHRLIIYDKLLPAGRLREPMSGKERADMVIITKCPKDLKPMEFRVLTKAMDLFPYQELYFTTIEYDKLTKMFGNEGEAKKTIEKKELKDVNVLLVTGIASPKLLLNDMKPYCKSIKTMAFGDHHMFSAKDINKINDQFAALPSPKIIVTTEKDATRIEAAVGLSEEAKEAIYAQPIHIKFMLDQQELFNNKIKSYVHKNSRNSILVKAKDDNKARNSNYFRYRSGSISFRDH